MSDTNNKENGNKEGDDLEVISDPNNPLSSKYKFDDLGLNDDLLKGVYGLGFEKPSKIQSVALPALLRGDNFIGQSQTGTGKTAAFSLSILGRIDNKVKTTQAMCICPTRELAQQVKEVISKLAQFTDISVELVIAGMKQAVVTSQVVVGTPGKLFDFVNKKDLKGKPLLDLKSLKILIVDEADNIINGDEKNNAMWTQTNEIKKKLPSNCQIGVFSATFPEEVEELVYKFVPAPRTTSKLKKEEQSLDKITQFYLQCENENAKYDNLLKLFRYLTVGSTIIFTGTRHASDMLKAKLTKDGSAVACLHGALEHDERDRVMEDFREHRARILISTNLISRGIDVSQVTLILNFDLPETKDGGVDHQTYLHRIGRSARFGKAGIAINFVHNKETFERVKSLSEYFGKEINEFKMESIEELSKMLEEIA